jgi:SAM-dependent methyltransferase
MARPAEVPLPPDELIARVGNVNEDAVRAYVRIGVEQRRLVEHYLPDTWDWTGKTLLDWGSGAGRLLRQFGDEAGQMQLIGADIDAPSIEWMRANLPDVEAVVVGLEPHIDLPDASVDVVTGFSVMTHITDYWAGWLLEVRRVLRPGGVALLSYISSTYGPTLLDGEWDEDGIGMLVLRYARPWSQGGPDVVHSSWWVRAHWGRAFEIVSLEPDPLAGGGPGTHHLALLRRPDSPSPTVVDMEAPEEGDPREWRGAVRALARARQELESAQPQPGTEVESIRRQYEAELEAVRREQAAEMEAIRSTVSWRVTAPLRAVRRLGADVRGPRR